jgi:hypothetical protein
MTIPSLFDEMDQVADALCIGSTFVDDLRFEFRQLQKCHHPELTTKQWHALFERWVEHYRAQQRAKEEAADVRAAELWNEHRSLHAERRFLPPGPLRQATERRLWEIGNAIADLYQSHRPPPLAASWAADEEKST